MLPAALFVGIQHMVALAMTLTLGLGQSPPFLTYGKLYVEALFAVAAVAGLIWLGQAIRARAPSPIAFMLGKARSSSYRAKTLLAGIILSWLQLVALTWFKSMIPLVTPMWADPMLADLDKWLFLGVDPGVAMQEALRPLADFIDRIYALWVLLLKLVFLAVLFLPLSRERSVALLAFFLTIGLLGSFGQYLLPSGGPIYFERLGYGPRFAAIDPPPMVAVTADYLWDRYLHKASGFATGISAFPSIHVATTTWMVIASARCMPAARWLFAAFLAVILVGSVYTGWHYAIDGAAGILGALGCYRLARWIIARQAPGTAQPDRIAPQPA